MFFNCCTVHLLCARLFHFPKFEFYCSISLWNARLNILQLLAHFTLLCAQLFHFPKNLEIRCFISLWNARVNIKHFLLCQRFYRKWCLYSMSASNLLSINLTNSLYWLAALFVCPKKRRFVFTHTGCSCCLTKGFFFLSLLLTVVCIEHLHAYSLSRLFFISEL